MPIYKLIMPKMGESITEATILAWHKQVGDIVLENEVVLEVATDKVDTDVPSEVAGTLKSILFEAGSVVAVGETLALIETENDITINNNQNTINQQTETETGLTQLKKQEEKSTSTKKQNELHILDTSKYNAENTQNHTKQFSPLVQNIAKIEKISIEELLKIKGTGLDGRLTKIDLLKYIENKKNENISPTEIANTEKQGTNEIELEKTFLQQTEANKQSGLDEIVEMDRVRKIIAKNMIESRKVSAHVSSFVECDVTKIVKWRETNKNNFVNKYGFNLTYLPIFIEAIAQAIKEFPNINVSIKDDKIIYKKDINIGIATALPNGNLVVPVIKNADRKNILGLASEINTLAQKARNNQLTIDDVSNGTYTVSNIGTFGNIIGTPIILQPQVAIMAVGAVVKKPVVLEINNEDVIAIRQMMFLSHTYDHRIIDGMLGGKFVKRVANILENFDDKQEI